MDIVVILNAVAALTCAGLFGLGVGLWPLEDRAGRTITIACGIFAVAYGVLWLTA